jgi:hypothetical protein
MKTKQKISKDLLNVMESLVSSSGTTIHSNDNKIKLKPVDAEIKDDANKSEKKALYTTISANQTAKLKKNDSISNILAKIYIALKEDRLEMIKQRELDRNFREEHIKEKERKYKSVKSFKYKKNKLKSDKGSVWGLLIMGLISESERIIDFVKDLVGPWDQFTKKITDQFEGVKAYVTNELSADITSFLEDLQRTVLAKVGQAYNGMMDMLESYLNGIPILGNIHLPRWDKFMETVAEFNKPQTDKRTPESDEEVRKFVEEQEQKKGKISTTETGRNLEIKNVTGRSAFDNLENVVNWGAKKVGKHISKEASNQYDMTKANLKKLGNNLADRSGVTYERITKHNDKISDKFTGHASANSTAKKLGKPTDPMVDKINPETLSKPGDPVVDKINSIPTENTITSKYLKEQSKNTDIAIEQTNGTSSITTLPPQVIPPTNTNKQPSVSISSPPNVRNEDPTVSHIQKKSTVRV